MAIQVTCPGCMKRFQVSDKFAGQKGPCPNCKKEITIPDKSEEVVIHAPETSGPKDSKGRSVLKPIFRQETQVTPVKIAIIVGSIICALAGALVMRFQFGTDEVYPWWPLIAGAVVLSLPLVLSGYAMLRDSEIEPHRGKDLWMRVAICAAIYAALWLLFPVAEYTFRGYNNYSLIAAVSAMFAIGSFISLAALEFEFVMGMVHYGIYFGACILLRWLAAAGPLPFDQG